MRPVSGSVHLKDTWEVSLKTPPWEGAAQVLTKGGAQGPRGVKEIHKEYMPVSTTNSDL